MASEQLRESFERLARANHVTGAQIAVLQRGEMCTAEWGEDEHGSGRVLSEDAKVPVGSITKTFTATLLMILVSDGDLDLDTPIGEYLPDLRRLSSDLADRLTARHLLSHTGGLVSDCGPPAENFPFGHCLLDTLQRPGAGFSYSNLGYAIAGRLIEVTTGMTWWEAMETILLKPLRITPAFVAAPGSVTSGAPSATGHAVNRALRRIRPVEQSLEPVEAPAGALALSATDLVTLARMHLRPEHGGTDLGLITPRDLAEMRTPVPCADPFGLADGWGLGLAWYRGGATGWLGHDGMADGTSCHLRVDPAAGTVVALTTNSSTGTTMWKQLVTELRTSGLEVGDYTGLTGTECRIPAPRECAGHYSNSDTEYSVVVRGDDVQLIIDGEPAARLTVYEELVFAVTDLVTGERGYPGRFLRNPRGGQVDRIQVGGRVATRRRHAREVA